MLIGAAVGASLFLRHGAGVPLALEAGAAAATGVMTYAPVRCLPTCEDDVMTDGDGYPVVDNKAASRFEVRAEDEIAELIYRKHGNRLVLVHTGVPDALGGRGIAGQLVQAAIDEAAASGMTVVPLCPYARSWLKRHPDEAAKVSIEWPQPSH